MRSRLTTWRVPGLFLVLMLLLSACATGGKPAVQQGTARVEAAPVADGEDTSAPAAAPAASPAASIEPTPTAPADSGEAVEQPQVIGLGAAPSAQPAPSTPPSTPRPETAPSAQIESPSPSGAAPETATPVSKSPYVFEVTAGTKDRTHPFYGIGSRLGFIVDGVQGKPLVLVRGHTYTFKVDTGVQHDFYFTTSSAGWGAAAYTKGISGQFTYNGIVTFAPTAETPDLLYYGCRNHKNMGGAIHVVNEGEEAKARAEIKNKSAAAANRPQPGQSQRDVTEAQVRQKIGFADMFINQSAAARRVKGSGNAEAQNTYRHAQSKFAASKEALAGGRNSEALALVDEAMRLMTEAGRQVPKGAQAEGQRARYQELLEGTRTFEDSYQRNYERMVEKKGKKNVRAVDLDAVHAAVDRAQRLADDEQYDEAIGVLTEAQGTLTSALSELLHDESISYELVFDTPKEEYEYELLRYLSYEELVPIAIEQRQPPPQTVQLMNQFIDKAKSIKKLSEPEAEKGNYKDAILMLQGATSHIQRALNAAGVR